MPYSSILVSLAGKKEEKKVVDEAVKLAKQLGSKISFIHVNDPGAGKMHMMMDSLKLVKESDVRDMLAEFGHSDLGKSCTINVIESSHYARTIADASKNYDLLVIGHHNKNSFLAALMDSTDEHISDMVDSPVLLVSL